MLNQIKLNQLKIGDRVLHFLLVNKFETKTTRTNKKYLNLDLSDKSGTINAKVWDNFDNLEKDLRQGSIVKIAGRIEEYSGQRQIKIDKIRIAADDDKINIEDFLLKSKRDLEKMKNELNKTIESLTNQYLKKLVQLSLSGETYKKFIKVPAGKSWHHAYIHGLLEHTLEIIKICDLMCDIHNELDRDLLITGAILHDLGKTEELNSDVNFDYTDEGRLLGHIVIAAIEVDKTMSKIDNFPITLKKQILHLILSHQGKLEYASPVEPKTLEAIVLYYADELSAKTNAYKTAINSSISQNNWTKFLPLANTSLFIPPKK